MTWDLFLGYATGLRFFVSGEMDWATLLRTLLVIHTCQAAMCRVLARNHGYSRNFWTVAGFVTGIWAVAVLMILPPRHPPRQ